MKVFDGYRLKKDVKLPLILKDIKDCVDRKMRLRYKELLEDEITYMVDEIVLKQIRIDVNKNIFELATESLLNRILTHQAMGYATQFNLAVRIEYIEFKGHTYISVFSQNGYMLDMFEDLEDLENISVGDAEGEMAKERSIIWREIGQYLLTEKIQPLSQTYKLEEAPDIKPSELSFKDVETRAIKIAENNVKSSLFRLLYANQSIQDSDLLVHIFNQIDVARDTDLYRLQIKDDIEKLRVILPIINTTIICSREKDNQEENKEEKKENKNKKGNKQ